MIWRGLAGIIAIAAPVATAATPVLGPAYGDAMVLQRGTPIVLAGTAQADGTVYATLGDTSAQGNVDADGNFTITLPARAASSRGLTLTLRDDTGSTVYDDILVGDVFLCSGQSNMELPVTRALDAANQLRNAGDDAIRLFKVPRETAAVPQADFAEPVAWQAASAETVADFSAACFYMAKQLRADDPGVSIGLIHSNWGGSAARAWLSPDGVKAISGEGSLGLLQTYANDPLAATQEFVPQWFDWWRAEDGGQEPWRDSSVLEWRAAPQISFWNEWTGTGLDTDPVANVWLRQSFTLDADQVGEPITLSIGAIDDLDLTFVNGNPVGYTFGWGVERTYTVPAAFLQEGENEVLIAANNAWDTGGFFAGADRLFVQPASGDPIPLGADWEYSIGAVQGTPPRAPWDANAGLGVMHNAMIAPLGPMRLAGVAWYQGESDVGQPDYDAKLRELFAGWRAQFGQQARMLVVQLADFGQRQPQPVESGWAQLRQEQLDAVRADDNAALVSAIDIGEPNDIHPANKNDLGRRLAAAFAGQAMPMPAQAVRNEGRIEVRFTGIEGGLMAQGGPYPLGVELCEAQEDSCRWALPHLAGDTMLIAIPEGFNATRVRHAWSDAPIVNLYDARGYPVPGFELAVSAAN